MLCDRPEKKKSYSRNKIHSESFVSCLSTLWNTASLWLGPLRFDLINEIISASRAAPSQKCLQQQKKKSAHRFNSLSSQQTSVNSRSQSVLERGSKSQPAQSCNMNHSEASKDFIISIGDMMELKTNEQHRRLLVLFIFFSFSLRKWKRGQAEPQLVASRTPD